jgi:hypothetical protein
MSIIIIDTLYTLFDAEGRQFLTFGRLVKKFGRKTATGPSVMTHSSTCTCPSFIVLGLNLFSKTPNKETVLGTPSKNNVARHPRNFGR